MRHPLGTALLLVLAACATPDVAPEPRFAAAAADLTACIAREMAGKGLPALCIAVADGQEVVWARGFGFADRERGVPARADTIHRVGSVSKLCTDFACLQLVEQGKIELDAPVSRWLPELTPRDPFGVPLTLRLLMTHHAGLVREPPVGHYFDPSEPGLLATVASLADTELVYAPGTRLKYSNAGLAAVGLAVERAAGRPFAEHLTQAVLAPLGAGSASFVRTPAVERRLAHGWMWTLDGREFVAPEFDLALGPAGNLYASVLDLVRFGRALYLPPHDRGPRLVAEATLREMLRPQAGGSSRGPRIGLGPFLGELDGWLRAGHGGAVYGFASELAVLPEAGCAVAVVATLDFANAVPERIADRALRWVLASRSGATLAADSGSVPLGAAAARQAAGLYEGKGGRLRLDARGEELIAEPAWGFPATIRRQGDALLVDDRVAHGAPVVLEQRAVEIGGRVYERVEDGRPEGIPAGWHELIGEYGWDHDVLYLLEKDGALHLLIEWFADYPLAEAGADRFELPDHGLYAGEPVRIERDAGGRVQAVVVGAVRFPRRALPEPGETFHVRPVRDLEQLRSEALAAEPPRAGGTRASELVDLTVAVPGIRLDLRYATANNFLGAQVYPLARALLQRPAVEALARVQARLAPLGLGLLVHDAYRPWHVTRMFWDATPPELRIFVADPARGSRHNRGCAVDLTLCDLASGAPVEMPSGYDEFTPRAYPRYPGGTSLQRWHRERLRAAMEAEGFTVYEHEWWHFDYRDWQEYPVLDEPLR